MPSRVSGGEGDNQAMRIFVSYSHADSAARKVLTEHLSQLQRAGSVAVWHDRCLSGGDEWRGVIDDNLEAAHLVVLLVTRSFLNSGYCNDVELKRAMERHENGSARVLPVIVKPCAWENAPFAALTAVPTDGKPISKWRDRDEAWTIVTREIARLTGGIAAGSTPASASSKRVLPTADPTRYLTWLRDQHAYLDIRGMGAQVAERTELARVYTRLSVSGSVPRESRPSRTRSRKGTTPQLHEENATRDSRRELHEVLADAPHAALVGDPGSGKTTFLRFVAQMLARAHQGDSGAMERAGLAGDAPFPIFVRLSQFATYLSSHEDASIPDDAEEHFCRYLDHLLAGDPHGLPPRYLRDRMHAGGCMLLCDGLDEVPGTGMRERITRVMEKVVAYGAQVKNRHLIACRTRAWEGRAQLAGQVVTLRLEPFEDEEVAHFTDAWARALFRVPDGVDDDDTLARSAVEYREELRSAIASNPSGQVFARSPLMLTVLAVVHWSEKQLPEERAELYDRAVRYLLDTRGSHSSFRPRLRLEALQAIALAMFEHSAGVQRAISRTRAAQAVVTLAGCPMTEAEQFVEDEELHSGLLVARDEGLEFWHLTFQEYLAAQAFSPLNDRRWERLGKHLGDDRWGEVFLLLAGCERRNGLEEAQALIRRVLGTGIDLQSRARAVAIVGRMLRDISPSGGDATRDTDYAKVLVQILPIFEPAGAAIDERIRIDVGEALGAAGDPRLADVEGNRVFIAGGTFLMGAQSTDPSIPGFDPEAIERESPVHRVRVDAFRMGRYPVTVVEFSRFLAAGDDGYLSATLWSGEGLKWRRDTQRTAPHDWASQQKHPNRPIMGVSWYEADAYARWVDGRLPTEAEWEWAVRGAAARQYPWAPAKPTAAHASFDNRFPQPSPVGVYPLDVHEHGLRDLAGNGWEWCGDWYADYHGKEAFNPKGPPKGSSRVLRGGSFGLNARFLRGACRFSFLPEFDYGSVGFRVVWSVAGGQT